MTAPAAAGVNRVHCILINTVFAMPALFRPSHSAANPFFVTTRFRSHFFPPKFQVHHLTHLPRPAFYPSAQSTKPLMMSSPIAAATSGLSR
jgi:hypothetical protein